MRVLIVDDEETSLELLQSVLVEMGHEVDCATNGTEALEKLRSGAAHLVITDWEMPSMNGLELCRAIREEDFEGYVYIVMLTSRDSGSQKIEGLFGGADAFLVKPLNPEELQVSIKTAERILGLETRDLALFALAKLSESRDPETGAHIERVQSYARLVAQYLSTVEKHHDVIDTEFVRLIYQTSPLHDIGKVGIPDNVLLKPSKLNEGEMSIMRTHPQLGAQTLEASLQRFPNVRFLQMARNIAMSHHERWDGKGYPQGLSGENIPLPARIVALADVYDAVTSRRVYREAMSHAQARLIIVQERGAHFDPDIVDAFLHLEKHFIAIAERYRDHQTTMIAHEDEALDPIRVAADVTTSAQPMAGMAKILLVDDDPVICQLMANFLHAEGFDCIVCADGVEALSTIELHQPRLIICDWEMPGVDGLEVCRRLRSRSQEKHVHFILQTVRTSKEDLARAFDAGVDDFLGKPFDEAEVVARLRAGLRVVGLYDELHQQHQGSRQLNEQLQNINQRLQTLAITDDLTGLYNRRQAMHRLEEHWAACERYQRPVSVVSLDIDHFKQVNDVYGHPAGDIVLKRVAEIVRESVRTTDTVCRIGGEEFLVILPCQSIEEGEICAQRCRQAVALQVFEFNGHQIHVTISAGAASRQPDMQHCADLLLEADEALYAAKRSGRNAVRAARERATEVAVQGSPAGPTSAAAGAAIAPAPGVASAA